MGWKYSLNRKHETYREWLQSNLLENGHVEHYREFGRIISNQVLNWMQLVQDFPAVDAGISNSLTRRQLVPTW
jgi:hypothetical protein